MEVACKTRESEEQLQVKQRCFNDVLLSVLYDGKQDVSRRSCDCRHDGLISELTKHSLARMGA